MATQDRQAVLTILSLALGAFAIGVSEFAAMGLLPYYAADLSVTEPEAGHAVSAYALGVVVGAPVLAVLGSMIPRKLLLILLISFFGLGNLLSSMSTDLTTLIIGRFASGLPHGAFLGISMLFAAEFSPEGRKARGVAQVLMGLTIANVIGVPLAGAAGQVFGWRLCFVVTAAIAAASALMITRVAPNVQTGPMPSPLRELGALANRAVWSTLMIGAIGFGGVFAVYSYFSAAMLDATTAPAWAIPAALSGFGLGGVLGNLIAGRLADWSRLGGALLLLGGMVLMSLLYTVVIGDWLMMSLSIFLLGTTASLAIPLQMRLMDVAGEAQTLAAALNHAAFNAANALGPFLAGRALAAGHGWGATGQVGAALAAGGIVMLALAWFESRSRARRVMPAVMPAE
ncbi:MFS transporter [Alloyangia pacifica]|uniref:MFS transporter n=1 Tax=Alloyangia pacifica TaxID=311180 RepID=UPI001CD7D1B0|nr:MFS transporter [Alloyangia pacifica]MCA0994550.1 MFS transporter [Alloyangia pacifica]